MRDRTVEGDQAAARPDGEGQQVQVGDLTRAMDALGIRDGAIRKARL
jgi:hypothetical protein